MKSKQSVKTTTESIICPECGKVQKAKVKHTMPFDTYIHECKRCKYIIMESEWQRAEETRVSCRFIGGFQDTRTNKEDFALTPYLFGVWVTDKVIKVRGLGICWGYYSVYLGLGWNIPKNYPSFKVLSKNGN